MANNIQTLEQNPLSRENSISEGNLSITNEVSLSVVMNYIKQLREEVSHLHQELQTLKTGCALYTTKRNQPNLC